MNAHTPIWKPVTDAMRERWAKALRRDDLTWEQVRLLTLMRRADQVSQLQLMQAGDILRRLRP